MPLLSLLPRIRAARAVLPTLAAREDWPRERIEAFQLDRLNRLWAQARAAVPHYRDLDLPTEFASLAAFTGAVPPLDKALVREAPERFLAQDAAPGRWRRTGGSTGLPTRIYREGDAHRAGLRARYRALDRWALDVLDRSAMLWGHGASTAPGLSGRAERFAQPLFDRLRQRLRLDAYDLSEAALDRGLAELTRFRPLSLYGYSSAVARLAARAVETGVALPSLRVAVLTGEPAPAALRAQVEADLGCDVAVEYGSAETGVMATGHRDGTLRAQDDLVFVETVPAGDGRFEVLVTVLANASFPLLRYRIGDLTEAPIERPAAGFSILPEIAGRRTDVLVGGDGALVHASALRLAVEAAGVRRRFRARQDESRRVEVVVETTVDVPFDEAAVRDRVSALLGGLHVRVSRATVLPGNRAGKHVWVEATRS